MLTKNLKIGYTHLSAPLVDMGWQQKGPRRKWLERAQCPPKHVFLQNPAIVLFNGKGFTVFWAKQGVKSTQVVYISHIHLVRFPFMTTLSFTFVISRTNVIGMPKQRRKCNNNVVVKRENFQHTFYIISYDMIP